MEPFEYLQKNANDMATVVETYLVEETVELIYDNEKLDKWNSLVAELNLTGQNSIRQNEKSPIPFQSMNEQLKETFKVLCPTQVEITAYNLTPIPIEVLDLVRLSVKEQYFGVIEIWYDEKQKDPLCVGRSASWAVDDAGGMQQDQYGRFKTKSLCEQFIEENNLVGCKPYNYHFNASCWLIGRWADVKKSFAELKNMAKERFVFEQRNELNKTIMEAKRGLEDLEVTANLKFGI